VAYETTVDVGFESACRRVIRERQREPLADHGLGYVELLSRDARPDLVVERLEHDANTCIQRSG
jgi:hypothetical protein